MIKKKVEIDFDNNLPEVIPEIDKLQAKLDALELKKKNLGNASRDLSLNLNNSATAIGNQGQAALRNGGFVGVASQFLGGWVVTVKDSIEALELLTVGTNVSTAATEVATVATVAETTATAAETTVVATNTLTRQQTIVAKIKDFAATTVMTVAKGASTLATKVATGAQWLWNTAVMANPLVALVVTLVAVTAGIVLFTKHLIDSSNANEQATAKTAKNTEALKTQSREAARSGNSLQTHNDHLLAMAKAGGASSEALRKLALKHADEDVALKKNNATIASNTAVRERNTLALQRSTGASSDAIEKQEKLSKAAYDELVEQNKLLDLSYRNRRKIINQNEIEITTEKTSQAKERANKEKAVGDKISSDATTKENERIQKEKDKKNADLAEIDKITKEASLKYQLSLLTDKEQEEKILTDKYNEQLALFKLHGKETGDLELIFLNEKNDINLKYQEIEKANKKVIDDNATADALEKTKEIADLLAANVVEVGIEDARNKAELDRITAHELAKLELERVAAEKRMILNGATEEQIAQITAGFEQRTNDIKIASNEKSVNLTKAKFDFIAKISQDGINMLDSLEKMGIVKGKAAEKARKAFTLVQIGASTASAIASLVAGAEATGASAGPAYLPVKIATFTAGLVPILANIAKAKQLLGSGGGGASPSVASAGGGGGGASTGAITPPNIAYQDTPQNQLANSINANKKDTIVKAYVVSTEMTERQTLDNVINNGSKI